MSAAEDKFKILEEKLKALAEPEADGNLTIKVSKKDVGFANNLFRPSLVCTLAGARTSHVMNPELWLPRLMGGGRYTLAVYAPGGAMSALVDGIEIELSGDPRAMPDYDALDDERWAGPKSILYPLKKAPGSGAPTPLSIVSPPSTPPSTTVPQTQPSPGTGSSGATHQDEMRRLQEHYAAQNAALQQQLAEERRQRIEEAHRREIEAERAERKREMEAQRQEMERLKAEMRTAVATPPARAPSMIDGLRELLPVVLPMITSHMERSAERERRAEERQIETLKSLTARPAIDPMLKEILDRQAAEQLPMGAILQQTAAATASMTQQMMEMLRFQAEMNAGPEENSMIKVVREVGNAVQGIASAAASSATPKRRLPRQEPATVSPAPAPVAEPTQAMGDAPPASPQKIMERIKRLLTEGAEAWPSQSSEDRAKNVDEVAKVCVKSYSSEEFQAALEAAKFEPLALFKALMTEQWLASNFEYANAFGAAFTKHGKIAGIFQEGEEEDDGE